jgi:hypothetical protein
MTPPISDEIAAAVFAGDVVVCTELLEQLQEDPENGWDIVAGLIARVSNAEQARYVGALFLEDLLVFHGRAVLGTLGASMKQLPHLVEAVKVVDWTALPRPIREALGSLMEQNIPTSDR